MRDTLTEKVLFRDLRKGDWFTDLRTNHVFIKTAYGVRDHNCVWVDSDGIPHLGFFLENDTVYVRKDALEAINNAK